MISIIVGMLIATTLICFGFIAGEVVRWHIQKVWKVCPRSLLIPALVTGVCFSVLGGLIAFAIQGVPTFDELGSKFDAVIAVSMVWILCIIGWQGYVLAFTILKEHGGFRGNMGIIARAAVPAVVGTLFFIAILLA